MSVRVLLLWPGTDGAAAGNFGVPQLVILGSYVQAKTGARVEIRDLMCEQAFGPVSLEALLAGDDGRGYDIIALSIYSSFDHLKCEAIATLARDRWPDAVIVCGGYHASARPLDYIAEHTPYDVCVIGEGERPLCTIVESVAGGAPLRKVTLGPDAIDDLDELPPSDWSLLARYRNIARSVASQAQLYLSRGCPFDCAFCMERAKREVSWRPLSVERALSEVSALHQFLDLRGWTLYFGDALFGMRKSWRREFLTGLARLNIPVDKYWLLIRVDLVEDEDLRLFGAANCGLGFGLESGDPGLLATIRKSGRLDTYLDRMRDISARAREHDVPWGANVICGHPGETPATLERSAAYLAELFNDPRGTTGFLSVDPFRLYPGSPIDADRGYYEQQFGTRFHRPHWWDDGDPEFLAEWVDPSADLDWLQREAMQDRLLTPILAGIEQRFVYKGPARDYFVRAIRNQRAYTGPASRMQAIDRYYAWHRYLGRHTRGERARRADASLAAVARALRLRALPAIAADCDLPSDHPILAALETVPREQFVPLDHIETSTRDVPVPLDDTGLATVSAMHAYARAFSLLAIRPGDHVLDLGGGTGYGAALLHTLVGPTGHVLTVEIDPLLAARARTLLQHPNLHPLHGDALDPTTWSALDIAFNKVVLGFALDSIPDSWLATFPEGTTIVAPLRDGDTHRLTRLHHRGTDFSIERFEEVRYVPTRHAPPRVVADTAPARPRLPILP